MSASPLTAKRPNSIKTVGRAMRPLAAAVEVFKGGLAACKAGYYKAASGDPAEVVVGRFYNGADNTSGAAGDVSAEIEFFRERTLILVDNDGDALVAAADRESACSFLDDHTATAFAASKGVGAIVYDVTSEGVWVELPFPASPDDGGARIQSGTSTLVAGTKTITGVTLTASSRIVVTMKDAGGGAITGMAGFRVPVASRNTVTGQFVVDAIDDAKAVIATAVCTFDYLIIG